MPFADEENKNAKNDLRPGGVPIEPFPGIFLDAPRQMRLTDLLLDCPCMRDNRDGVVSRLPKSIQTSVIRSRSAKEDAQG